MKDLAGKVAVITGGASGIGFATAKELAKQGMRLVLADIEQGALDSAAHELSQSGADVIGVSVDSPFAQEAWAQKEKITVTLVSDLNKVTTKAYAVEFPGLAGIGDTSARAAFIVDKDGVVQYAEQTATPKDLPNFDAIKAKLAELK